MNSASLSADNSSFYPKICEVKYNSYFDQFEFESNDEDSYETSLYDLKDNSLKWRCPMNRENTTLNKETIHSILEVNNRGTYGVPTNSACSNDRPLTSRYSVVKIDDSFIEEKDEPHDAVNSQNSYRLSMPSIHKSYTQNNLKETKIYPKITKQFEKLPSPRGYNQIPVSISNRVEASISQRGFTIPPIHPPPPVRKEHTTFLHFVTNPFSFNEKPKNEKKLITYPALIRTRKFVPIEPVKTETKVIKKEEKEYEEDKTVSKDKVITNGKTKRNKNKKQKNKKKKNRKNKDIDASDDSLSEIDSIDNIEPTNNQSNRPMGASISKMRQRGKIIFLNGQIQEYSEDESEEPVEDFKELEKEVEKVEERVKQEQEELSNYEYTSNLKLMEIKLKEKEKRKIPPIKPKIIQNKTDFSRGDKIDEGETPEDEKNKKEFHLRPLERPFRIPENKKLLGQDTEEYILEDDWLLKWCILENFRNVACETAFAKFDRTNRGFLRGEELIQAIESIVKLNNLKLTYLFSVLNLVNVDALIFGADLKLFTIIVTLANRISNLDDNWFSNLLPQYDLFTIENKVFKVKNLWNYLADLETKLIYIKDVLIEFEAGGVTSKHIEYAKEKFSQKIYFDIVDYLTYIPLFVHIHDKIIRNPLIINQDI